VGFAELVALPAELEPLTYLVSAGNASAGRGFQRGELHANVAGC